MMESSKYEQNKDLFDLLSAIENGKTIDRSEIEKLLRISEPLQISRLFDAARHVRQKHFGNRIFLYGFIYFSTYCRNNCHFCQYRKDNINLARYRKTEEQILTAALELADTGVHLIDLTMGEDPELYSPTGFGFSYLTSIIKKIRQKTGLPVMISPGVVPDETIGEMARIGTNWYACYQETHNKQLYNKLRPGQDYQKRLHKKLLAKKRGMLIEEGLLTNIGESTSDLAESIEWMRNHGVDQARAMTFVPQPGTPMSKRVSQGNLQELITIAVMRLALPDRLIPASLDVDGLNGLKARLNAGASVVTSIVPPEKGLAGVANRSLDIEDSRRSLDHILPVLESCGLKAASLAEYTTWIQNRQVAADQCRNEKLRMVC